MTNIQEIDSLLSRMTALLNLGSQGSWASALERHRANLEVEPIATAARMLAMYGGMGSLNDVILYRDGQPLAKENNEFYELRSRLYELCHNA
jgi:hypothetical protein